MFNKKALLSASYDQLQAEVERDTHMFNILSKHMDNQSLNSQSFDKYSDPSKKQTVLVKKGKEDTCFYYDRFQSQDRPSSAQYSKYPSQQSSLPHPQYQRPTQIKQLKLAGPILNIKQKLNADIIDGFRDANMPLRRPLVAESNNESSPQPTNNIHSQASKRQDNGGADDCDKSSRSYFDNSSIGNQSKRIDYGLININGIGLQKPVNNMKLQQEKSNDGDQTQQILRLNMSSSTAVYTNKSKQRDLKKLSTNQITRLITRLQKRRPKQSTQSKDRGLAPKTIDELTIKPYLAKEYKQIISQNKNQFDSSTPSYYKNRSRQQNLNNAGLGEGSSKETFQTATCSNKDASYNFTEYTTDKMSKNRSQGLAVVSKFRQPQQQQYHTSDNMKSNDPLFVPQGLKVVETHMIIQSMDYSRPKSAENVYRRRAINSKKPYLMKIMCADEKKCNFQNLSQHKVPNFKTTINVNKEKVISIDRSNSHLNQTQDVYQMNRQTSAYQRHLKQEQHQKEFNEQKKFVCLLYKQNKDNQQIIDNLNNSYSKSQVSQNIKIEGDKTQEASIEENASNLFQRKQNPYNCKQILKNKGDAYQITARDLMDTSKQHYKAPLKNANNTIEDISIVKLNVSCSQQPPDDFILSCEDQSMQPNIYKQDMMTSLTIKSSNAISAYQTLDKNYAPVLANKKSQPKGIIIDGGQFEDHNKSSDRLINNYMIKQNSSLFVHHDKESSIHQNQCVDLGFSVKVKNVRAQGNGSRLARKNELTFRDRSRMGQSNNSSRQMQIIGGKYHPVMLSRQYLK